MSSRFFTYMRSPAGRYAALVASAGLAVGGSCVLFLPHSFMNYKYKEIVTHYQQGFERPLSQPVQDRFETALNHLNLPEFERKFVKAFSVTGLDTCHIGSLRLRFGANVGIPANFSYTNPNDIEKSELISRGNPIDWSSHAGKLLEESLVMKEDEQVFAIAREILYMKENNIILQSLYPAIGIFTYYSMTHNLNTKLKLLERPFPLRLGIYWICAFFAFGIYAFATDYHQVSLDINVDKKLSELGEKFVEAGIRFYDKLLKKNMAIRELNNDDNFTATGNENHLLRHKTFPLDMRKKFFELKKKEMHEEKTKKSEEIVIDGSNDIQVQ